MAYYLDQKYESNNPHCPAFEYAAERGHSMWKIAQHFGTSPQMVINQRFQQA